MRTWVVYTPTMKLFTIAMLVALGCGGSKKSDDTTMSSGGGGADMAMTAGGGTPCAQEIALECGAGMADGCMDGKTTMHACVAADAVAGPPCAQEIAQVCPDGQVDACLQTPASAATHICVAK